MTSRQLNMAAQEKAWPACAAPAKLFSRHTFSSGRRRSMLPGWKNPAMRLSYMDSDIAPKENALYPKAEAWHRAVQSRTTMHTGEQGRAGQELGVVDALRPRDDFLAADEDVEGVAVPRVICVWHGVEGPRLPNPHRAWHHPVLCFNQCNSAGSPLSCWQHAVQDLQLLLC